MSTNATQQTEPRAPSKSNNLLCILHKWASGQDENFVTDSFAHLLRCLLVREPGVAVDLLAELTGAFIRLAPEQAPKVNVETQVTTDHGRPDMEISLRDYLAYVEVKVEQEVRQEQLGRYEQALQKSGVPHTRLILLTRYPQMLDSEKETPDNQGQWFSVRWFQIAHWLERSLCDDLLTDPVGVHVVSQFVSFLQVRNIAMQQVRPELSAGVRSLRSLLSMVAEALASCKVSSKTSKAWEYIGFDCDSNRFWVGLYYDEPEALVFETNEPTIRCATRPVARAVFCWPPTTTWSGTTARSWTATRRGTCGRVLGKAMAIHHPLGAPSQNLGIDGRTIRKHILCRRQSRLPQENGKLFISRSSERAGALRAPKARPRPQPSRRPPRNVT